MVSGSEVPAHLVTSWKTTEVAPSRPRLCSACDACRQSRVKCFGGSPCQRCQTNRTDCHYSLSMRNGRSKANRVQKSSPIDRHHATSSNTFNAKSTAPISAPNPVSHHDNHTCDKGIFSLESCPTAAFNQSPLLTPSTELPIGDPSTSLTDSSSSSALPPSSDLLFGIDLGSTHSIDDEWGPTGLTNLCVPLDLMDFGVGMRTTRCTCLKTQLLCIAELCGPQDDVDRMGLDAILEASRRTCEQITQELSCNLCVKGSTRYILTVISLQQILGLFCRVAKNGSWYICNARLGMGTFQLSEEEDCAHKSLLVISGLKRLEKVVNQLTTCVRDFQHAELLQQSSGEMATETGRSNLKWTMEAVLRMKSRLRIMAHMVESRDWGSIESSVQQDP